VRGARGKWTKVSIRVDDDGAAVHGFMMQHSAQQSLLVLSSCVDCLYFSSFPTSLLDCYIYSRKGGSVRSVTKICVCY